MLLSDLPVSVLFYGHARRISAPTGETDVQGGTGMKAIVVTDRAAGTAGMKLVEQPEPQAAINDVIVTAWQGLFEHGRLQAGTR